MVAAFAVPTGFRQDTPPPHGSFVLPGVLLAVVPQLRRRPRRAGPRGDAGGAHLNALPSENLRTHLFGRERSDLVPVREALRDLQQGRCLYCEALLRGQGQVDHVVPWSLHPQDAIENLVLTHDRCNGSKSAYLLDLDPLRSWAERDLADLAGAAASVGWTSASGAVFSTVRSAYAHSAAARLWSPAGIRLADPDELRDAFLPLLQVA